MVEVLVNDKFIDPNDLDEKTRKVVRAYLTRVFLEMSRADKPNEKKLTELSKYLHKYFPELFDLSDLLGGEKNF